MTPHQNKYKYQSRDSSVSSSGPTRNQSKCYHLRPKKKTILFRKLKMSAVCALHDCLNPIFLGGVVPELLFNQFLWVLYIAI